MGSETTFFSFCKMLHLLKWQFVNSSVKELAEGDIKELAAIHSICTVSTLFMEVSCVALPTSVCSEYD